MSLTYIPAMECWQNALRIDNKEELRIVYSDDYEHVQKNGVTREFHYVGNNIIIVRQTGKEDMVCHNRLSGKHPVHRRQE